MKYVKKRVRECSWAMYSKPNSDAKNQTSDTIKENKPLIKSTLKRKPNFKNQGSSKTTMVSRTFKNRAILIKNVAPLIAATKKSRSFSFFCPTKCTATEPSIGSIAIRSGNELVEPITSLPPYQIGPRRQ